MNLLPQPPAFRRFPGAFRLDARARLECADLFTSDAFQVARHLRDRLRDVHGLALLVGRTGRAGKGSVLLGTFDDPAVLRALGDARLRADPAQLGPEGYALAVSWDRAVLAKFPDVARRPNELT